MEFVAANILELFAGMCTIAAGVWALIKYLQNRIDVLHARINNMRNEYVHRDHLDDILNGIEKSVGNVASEQRRTNERLDDLFKHLLSEAKK